MNNFAMLYHKLKEMPIDTTSAIGLAKTSGYGIAVFAVNFLGLSGVRFQLIEGLAILMVIDTLTGLLKWAMIDKRKVKSRPLSEGVIKKIIALFIPICLGIATKTLGWQPDFLLTSTFTMLCLAETYSIFGNLYSAYTKNPIEEYDAISAILKFVKDKIYEILKAALKNKQ